MGVATTLAKGQPPPREPVARVVLLGASNLRLGLPTILRQTHRALGGPIDYYVAHGFGRSYGRWSSVPGRSLPGILQCDLWDDLARSPSLPTFAMLTDVGNDLLYGRSPSALVDWVSECSSRLRAYQAQMVFTELPIASLKTVGKLRYQLFRTIFFPPSQLSYEQALQRAEETNLHLQTLAETTSSRLIRMKKTWYGIDPIHVHWRHRKIAWKQVVEAWRPVRCGAGSRVLSLKNRLSMEFAAPAERRLFGWRRTCNQPCMTSVDQSTLSLY